MDYNLIAKVMAAERVERALANIHRALKILMERYERAPRHRGEKHKIYRSILLLQEEIARTEVNRSTANVASH